jgi:hypothetical protein
MKKRGKLILGIIQLFVAIGALPVGYLMIIKPDGSGVGMTHFLQPTYFIIGIGEIILSIYIYKTEKLNLTN